MREIKFRLIFRDKVLGYELNMGGEWWYSVDNDNWERGEIKTRSRIDKTIKKNQYTGLKDKNGKEIYEGDILKVEPDGYEDLEGTFQVKWGEDYPAFDLYELSGKSVDVEYNILSYDPPMEVIGNIYENKGLIK